MENKIDKLRIIKFNGYVEVHTRFRIPIPPNLLALPNKKEIAEYYQADFNIDNVNDNMLIFNFKGSFPNTDTPASIQSQLESAYNLFKLQLDNFVPDTFSSICGFSFDGNEWAYTPVI